MKFWDSMTPETRQLAIKAAVVMIGILGITAVGVVVAIARNGGLDGLFELLKSVI